MEVAGPKKVVECDAGIQLIYFKKGESQKFINGGDRMGFNAPIVYVITKLHPNCLIYFFTYQDLFCLNISAGGLTKLPEFMVSVKSLKGLHFHDAKFKKLLVSIVELHEFNILIIR